MLRAPEKVAATAGNLTEGFCGEGETGGDVRGAVDRDRTQGGSNDASKQDVAGTGRGAGLAAIEGFIEGDITVCGSSADGGTNGVEQHLIAEGDIAAITICSTAIGCTTGSGDGGVVENDVLVVGVEGDITGISTSADTEGGITTGAGHRTVDEDPSGGIGGVDVDVTAITAAPALAPVAITEPPRVTSPTLSISMSPESAPAVVEVLVSWRQYRSTTGTGIEINQAIGCTRIGAQVAGG